jgi:2,3-bisphosphoglycerate-dependent phosphoglycerate mutase
MLKHLYLVRHAHPKPGTGLVYDRAPGPPLSDLGRDEARAAGLYLAQCGVERLYVSPLERTLETARIIADESGLPMQIEDALAEHRSDETFDHVKTRMRDLLARVDCEPITAAAFVTHGSPIKALLQILSSESFDLSRHVFDSGNHSPTAGIWLGQRDVTNWNLEMVFQPAPVRTR